LYSNQLHRRGGNKGKDRENEGRKESGFGSSSQGRCG
jgi:hypothetical protein